MKQCKNMMVILYEEPQRNLIEALSPKKWAYILHDKDLLDDGTLKKAHYHLLMSFESKKSLSLVGKMLNVEENLIECIKNYKALERYLIHLDNPEKNQYNVDDVISNYDYATEVYNTPDSILQFLVESCEQYENIRDFNLMVMKLGVDYMKVYKKYYSMIKDVIYFQNKDLMALRKENRQNNGIVSNMCNDELLKHYKNIVLNDSHEPFDELIVRECINRDLIVCRGLRVDENFEDNGYVEMGYIANESDKED